MSGRRGWLVGYDITSPRRLRRVHRFLVRRAVQVQYSLFVASWTEVELNAALAGLGQLIDPRRDDVRAWPLPERAEVERFGRGLPEGIFAAISRPRSVAAVLECRPGRERNGQPAEAGLSSGTRRARD